MNRRGSRPRLHRRPRVSAAVIGVLWLLAGVANAAALGTCPAHDHSLGVAGTEHGTPAAHDHGEAEHHDHGEAASVAADSHSGEHAAGSSDEDHACTCGALCCITTPGATDVEVAEASVFDLPIEEPEPFLPEVDQPAPLALAPHFLPPSIGPPRA